MSCSLLSPSLCSTHGHGGPLTVTYGFRHTRRSTLRICATADGPEPNDEPILDFKPNPPESPLPSSSSSPSALGKDLKKVVTKTAATFAPRASTASKNPAVPGTTLYRVFEAQAYASMLLGGVLSFNLLFPSNQPDIWRLMGMWSIWMFSKSPFTTFNFLPTFIFPLNPSSPFFLPAIPSLRARDCPTKEKEALNYLFLIIPLLNVAIPFFWKSFPLVWSADTLAFFAMYAWKVCLLLFFNCPLFLSAASHFIFLLLQLGWLETTE